MSNAAYLCIWLLCRVTQDQGKDMEYKDMKIEHKLGRRRGEFQKTRFDDDVPV